MAKSFADHSSDIAFFILRPAIQVWMRLVAKRDVECGEGVDFKRRTPFVLLANHSFSMDVVHVPLPFKITPQIVASRDLFVKPFERFILSYVARCIMAPKGGGDVRTIKEIMRAIQAGYPVLLFPEGDISYFGHTEEAPKAIAMLVRRLGLDVITCRVSGGYLSAPRWARAARGRRRIQLRYELALSSEDTARLSLGELHEAIDSRLSHDEYTTQRELMTAHPTSHGAEGLEDVLYVCPVCRAIASMTSSGNQLACVSCGTKGSLDEYGFLHGWTYDNPSDWDAFQRGLSFELRQARFNSDGTLFINDYKTLKQTKLGRVRVEYFDSTLRFNGALHKDFSTNDLRDVSLTMRSNLNFTGDGIDYILTLDRLSLAFLRACQDRY